MRFRAVFAALGAIICSSPALAGADGILYRLGDPDVCEVVIGELTLEHSPDGPKSPGMVTLSDLRGLHMPANNERAVVNIGEEFAVEPDAAYHLSAWIKALGKRGWNSRVQSRPMVTWYDDEHREIGLFWTPWAYGDYDWLEYSAAAIAPANAVTAQTAILVTYSTYGPLPGGYTPTPFQYNHLRVSRTPKVLVSTGKQCNLVFDGEPLDISVSINGLPEGYGHAAFKGVLRDYWRNPVDTLRFPLAGETLESTHTIPNLGRGYYSLEWTLTPDSGPIRAGTISLAVIPAPGSRRPIHDSPFAIDAGLSVAFDDKPQVTLENGTYMAKAAGVHILRERTGPKSATEFMKARGVEAYHMMWRSYENALRNEGPEDRCTGSLHLREVYDGAKRTAEEYRGLVRYWEVWNEADAFFFPGRAEEYAGLQKAAYLGIYAGNPGARVLNASLSEIVTSWHDDLFRNGLNDYFDIFNMHFYDTPDGRYEPLGVLDMARDYLDVLERCRVPPKQNWLTEMGYPLERHVDGTWWRSEQHQAMHAVTAACCSVAAGMDKFFYFYLQEYFEHGWFMWGITRRDWTPKPAYAAYAIMTYELGQGRYLGEYDLGAPERHGFVFESGSGPVLFAWAAEETPLDLPGEDVTALDIMGTPTAPRLSKSPVYIKGIDLNSTRFRRSDRRIPPYSPPDIDRLTTILCLRAVSPKDSVLNPKYWSNARKQPLVIGHDEPVSLELKVCNFSETPQSIALAWKIPDGWDSAASAPVELKAGPWSETDWPVVLVPAGAQSGRFYVIEVTGSAPGMRIAPVRMRVQVR